VESSVADPRFGCSDPFTVGVEEEYMVVDPESRELVQRVGTMLAAEEGGEFVELVAPELFDSVLEVHTPVCASASDVARELRRLRAHVAEAAAAQGLWFASAGTHPFSLFERQRITPRDRYLTIVEQLQYAARRELIFGLHVHVAVDGAAKAIAVFNALFAHVPELIALSASSPFWRGDDTGVASSRQLVFAPFPRSGLPPRFDDYEQFATVLGSLEASGCVDDYTHIWWDLRPHPRLGTIEMRAMDAVTCVDDATALAAYVQSLVKRYSDDFDAGRPLPRRHRTLVAENRWRSIRFGLAAELIDLEHGARSRIPVTELVRRTLAGLRPHARELGGDAEIEGIERILSRGNGADRQRSVFGAKHDLLEVVRDVAELSAAAVVPAAA
jgi:glutamate---cysteine ligase / carboxylate-amine ligase